jgi:AmmeMemoRadiSam system protein A
MPLYQIVSQMAVAASTQDPRFAYNPITVQEMGEIDIKISILSEMKKIDSIDEIEIGKHGIYIHQNGRRGTYLPEVATEQGWNKIEFLEHCCMEKAGLPRDAWKKDADIFIYSSQILSEIE